MSQSPPTRRISSGLIIIVLLLACVGTGVFAIMRGSPSGNSDIGTGSSPGASATVSLTPSAIGTAVRLGNWNITVERAEEVRQIIWSDSGDTQEANGVFVKLYLTVENTSNLTESVRSPDFRLIDSQRKFYGACISFACINYPGREGRDYFSHDVAPGSSSKLLALFAVATDADSLQLVIQNQARLSLGQVPGP